MRQFKRTANVYLTLPPAEDSIFLISELKYESLLYNIPHFQPRSAGIVPNLVHLSTPRWEGLYRSRLALFTLDRPPGRGACSGSGMGGLCTGVSATLYTDSFLYM